MSQENVDVVKSFTSRFEAGDRNVWRDYFEPDVVWDTSAFVFRQGGIGQGSGVRTERDFFGVYDLNDSKVIRYRQYESRKEALEAVGLSE